MLRDNNETPNMKVFCTNKFALLKGANVRKPLKAMHCFSVVPFPLN